jgi:pyruvate-formate lyase
MSSSGASPPVARVAGYSARFTELDRDLQDEIIRRTGFVDS